MSTPTNSAASRVAIIAAVEQEISQLVRGWTWREIEEGGKRLRFYESDRAVVVCGGIGRRAARSAAEAAVRVYKPQLLASVGFAGSLGKMKVSEAFLAAKVIEASGGKTYSARRGTGILLTADKVLGRKEKHALAERFAGDAVDMEAAAVAEVAEQAGLHFFAVKAISDELEFPMPPMDRFVDSRGNFATARFTLHTALRPWTWLTVWRLGRNSRTAARALTLFVGQLIQNQDSAANAVESNLAKINQ